MGAYSRGGLIRGVGAKSRTYGNSCDLCIPRLGYDHTQPNKSTNGEHRCKKSLASYSFIGQGISVGAFDTITCLDHLPVV